MIGPARAPASESRFELTKLTESEKREIAFNCLRGSTLAEWVYDTQGVNGRPGTLPPIPETISAQIFIQNKETDTEGSAIVTDDKIYIVMRGTESLSAGGLRDWTTNVRAYKNPAFRRKIRQIVFKKHSSSLLDRWEAFLYTLKNEFSKAEFFGISAHPGFVEATNSVLQQVVDILDMYKTRRQVVLIGHSLGGALAVLLGVAINHQFRKFKDPRELSIYTTGQPRVSRRRQLNLALRFVPYIRLQVAGDIVPRIPRIGYSHGGDCLYLTQSAVRAAEKGKPVSRLIKWNPGQTYKFIDRLGSGIGRIRHHAADLPIKILAGYLR